MLRNPKHFVFFATCVLLASSCASLNAQWAEATQSNTVAAYAQFLSEHPKSEQAPEARRRLHQLAFSRASSVNTVSAYEDFLDRFPNSVQAANSRAQIEALQAQARANREAEKLARRRAESEEKAEVEAKRAELQRADERKPDDRASTPAKPGERFAGPPSSFDPVVEIRQRAVPPVPQMARPEQVSDAEAERIAALIARLGIADEVSRRAENQLLTFGRKALPQLHRAFRNSVLSPPSHEYWFGDNPWGEPRRHAIAGQLCYVIAHLEDFSFADLLIDGLKRGRCGVAALVALLAGNGDDLVRGLQRLLMHAGADGCRAVAEHILRISAPEAGTLLDEALRDQDPNSSCRRMLDSAKLAPSRAGARAAQSATLPVVSGMPRQCDQQVDLLLQKLEQPLGSPENALTTCVEPSSVNLIAARASAVNFMVRRRVAMILGAIAEPSTLPTLLFLAKDTKAYQARDTHPWALSSISRFGSRRAGHFLLTALTTPNQHDEMEVARAILQSLSPVAIETVRAMTVAPPSSIPASFWPVLLLQGDARSEPALVWLLDRKGTIDMASAYLNSGNAKLEAAARDWASRKGIPIREVKTTIGGSDFRWGGR